VQYEYVVLAAFENDALVRDPDPNIAGTQIVQVDMPTPGTDVTLSTAFQVTDALAVTGPAPTLPKRSPPRPTWSGPTPPAKTSTPWSSTMPTASACGVYRTR